LQGEQVCILLHAKGREDEKHTGKEKRNEEEMKK
jgi:hypothetical protein